MAPKAKVRAKAKAKVRARAVAKAKVRVRRPGGRLRRPAHAPGAVEPPLEDARGEWDRGQVVEMRKIPIEALGRGVGIVMEEASYYLGACRAAGIIKTMEVDGGEVHLGVAMIGTTHEGILKHHSGNPQGYFRVHRCGVDCSGDAVADDLIHCYKVRKLKPVAEEEGWTRNLEKTVPLMAEHDDLRALRQRGEALAPMDPGAAETPKDKSKEDTKDKKDKKKKKKEKKKKDESEEKSNSSKRPALDGSRCKAASVKTGKALFSGTGLDVKDKVRRKVMRRARKAMKKKKKEKSSSGSESSSSTASVAENTWLEDSLFSQGNKVKEIGERFPGALSSQALNQMRSGMLQDLGLDSDSTELKPMVLQYVRQQLLRRASPPVQRELLTIGSAVDLLLKYRAAAACDVLLQRLKAMESVLAGSHWAVAQKLELVGKDGMALAGVEEMTIAQKDAYQEQRSNWLSSLPAGQGSYQGKGRKDEKGDRRKGKDKGGKGKSDSKNDRGGKNQKDDANKSG